MDAVNALLNRISHQISIIKNALRCINNPDAEADLAAIIDDFNINTYDILNGTTEDYAALNDILVTTNIEGRLATIFYCIKGQLNEERRAAFDAQMNYYYSSASHTSSNNSTSSKCECGTPYLIDSILPYCESCRLMKKTLMVAGSSVLPGQKLRPANSKDQLNTIYKALNKIQGNSKLPINEQDMARIGEAIRMNGYKLIPSLDCDDLRQILKKLGLTKYNDEIPLLLKHFTWRSLVVLTELEQQQIIFYYVKVAQAFDMAVSTFRGDKVRKNKINKYYVLYKLAEFVIEDKKRLAAIAQVIHFQSLETIIKFDINWEDICGRLNEQGIKIKFNKTDRKLIR
jgi:hypothetical protein